MFLIYATIRIVVMISETLMLFPLLNIINNVINTYPIDIHHYYNLSLFPYIFIDVIVIIIMIIIKYDCVNLIFLQDDIFDQGNKH